MTATTPPATLSIDHFRAPQSLLLLCYKPTHRLCPALTFLTAPDWLSTRPRWRRDLQGEPLRPEVPPAGRFRLQDFRGSRYALPFQALPIR